MSDFLTTTTQWETEVVAAWGKERDCSRSTGMCDACGIGAVVVEMDEATGKTSTRSIMAGPDGNPPPYDYDTQTFEIASYTKHFTALSMVFLENEIPGFADSTLRDWLPCEWEKAKSPDVATITLEELRLHTSGLPPQATNHDLAGNDGNPFAGYTEEMMCNALLGLTALPARHRFVYSNFAYGILGYALTFASATIPAHYKEPPDYETVINQTVLVPLGMNQTSVKLDDHGWQNAAKGCDRGMDKGNYAIRRGQYGVLQGNGALRSTLRDMARFLEVSLKVTQGYYHDKASLLTPMQRICFDAAENLGKRTIAQEACTCVSGWCEGNLCPLPNPVKEMVADNGATLYTSGGVEGWRKSGDTEGYSVRGAWSGDKRRAVFVVDTCGGCGERGTSGSAAQRVALLLADGPPDNSNKPVISTADGTEMVRSYVGVTDSHIFPSLTNLEVQIRRTSEGAATISVASSDGMGCSASARQVSGDTWEFDTSVLYGCGFGGDDPLALVPQKRSFRILADGSGATLQEMGEDIYLTPKGKQTYPAVIPATLPTNVVLMSASVILLMFFATQRSGKSKQA